jgi:hypothetical protein
VAESCTICSSSSRLQVLKLLDTPSSYLCSITRRVPNRIYAPEWHACAIRRPCTASFYRINSFWEELRIPIWVSRKVVIISGQTIIKFATQQCRSVLQNNRNLLRKCRYKIWGRTDDYTRPLHYVLSSWILCKERIKITYQRTSDSSERRYIRKAPDVNSCCKRQEACIKRVLTFLLGCDAV